MAGTRSADRHGPGVHPPRPVGQWRGAAAAPNEMKGRDIPAGGTARPVGHSRSATGTRAPIIYPRRGERHVPGHRSAEAQREGVVDAGQLPPHAHRPPAPDAVRSVNFDRQSIINNNVALAKAARVFGVPVVLSTVETRSFSGNLWPQVQAVFPGQQPIERTSMNSWDDDNFVAAIKKTGKKKIVLTGLWTEPCVALPTVQAIHDGFDVYVVEDC